MRSELSAYARQHSYYWIWVSEHVLRQILSTKPPLTTAPTWHITGKKASTPLPVLPGISRSGMGLNQQTKLLHGNTHVTDKPNILTLCRTANVRKCRAFSALTKHDVFLTLPETEKEMARQLLQKKLQEIFMEDFRLRANFDDAEIAGNELEDIKRYLHKRGFQLPWEVIAPEQMLLKADAARLLNRLESYEGQLSMMHAQLRGALKAFLQEDGRVESGTVNVLAQETKGSVTGGIQAR